MRPAVWLRMLRAGLLGGGITGIGIVRAERWEKRLLRGRAFSVRGVISRRAAMAGVFQQLKRRGEGNQTVRL